MIEREEIRKEHFRIVSCDEGDTKKYTISFIKNIQSQIEVQQNTKLNFDRVIQDELIKQMESEMFNVIKMTDAFRFFLEVLKHQILMRTEGESRGRIINYFEGDEIL